MSEGLNRILLEVSAFSEGIKRYRSSTSYNATLCRDAYNGLSRIRERYEHERDKNRSLEPDEEKALRKVFEEDEFIKGMLHARQIGEHVQINEPVIRLMTGGPIKPCVETSAGSLFAGRVGIVRDVEGTTHYIDHVEYLERAEKRVQRALELAQKN
jgi:hypothetical protein